MPHGLSLYGLREQLTEVVDVGYWDPTSPSSSFLPSFACLSLFEYFQSDQILWNLGKWKWYFQTGKRHINLSKFGYVCVIESDSPIYMQNVTSGHGRTFKVLREAALSRWRFFFRASSKLAGEKAYPSFFFESGSESDSLLWNREVVCDCLRVVTLKKLK